MLCNTQASTDSPASFCNLQEGQRHDVCSLVEAYPTLFQDVHGQTGPVMYIFDVGAVAALVQPDEDG